MDFDRFENVEIGIQLDGICDIEEYSIPETTDNGNEMSNQEVPIGNLFPKVELKKFKKNSQFELENCNLKAEISKFQAQLDN